MHYSDVEEQSSQPLLDAPTASSTRVLSMYDGGLSARVSGVQTLPSRGRVRSVAVIASVLCVALVFSVWLATPKGGPAALVDNAMAMASAMGASAQGEAVPESVLKDFERAKAEEKSMPTGDVQLPPVPKKFISEVAGLKKQPVPPTVNTTGNAPGVSEKILKSFKQAEQEQALDKKLKAAAAKAKKAKQAAAAKADAQAAAALTKTASAAPAAAPAPAPAHAGAPAPAPAHASTPAHAAPASSKGKR